MRAHFAGASHSGQEAQRPITKKRFYGFARWAKTMAMPPKVAI
jgi:hypothetical protein